jgi:hypothetical protein
MLRNWKQQVYVKIMNCFEVRGMKKLLQRPIKGFQKARHFTLLCLNIILTTQTIHLNLFVLYTD